ncbi:MAG: hypothetical protein ACH350_05415 [Parachlamydiaceae bacterium]
MNANDPPSSQNSKLSPEHVEHSLVAQAPEYVYIPNKPLSEEPSKMFSSEDHEGDQPPAHDELGSVHAIGKEKEAASIKKWSIEKLSNLKEEFLKYMKTHTENTIIYILLILGLMLMLFTSSLLGALIIGMVGGYYFASQIIYFIRNLTQLVGGQDQLHYVVLATIALGLFIEAPGIFIGAIIVATFKQVLISPQV